MDDARIWEFEQSFWTGGVEAYKAGLDEAALMILPMDPPVLDHAATIKGIEASQRWSEADFTARHVARPEEGIIVIAYRVKASRGSDAPYEAWCSSTFRRISHNNWRLFQHHQTPITNI